MKPGRKNDLNMLTAAEFHRLIARMGGLWSGSMLVKEFGKEARSWPAQKNFPPAAWVAGQSKLYSGWEVWNWLIETERYSRARTFGETLEKMRRAKA
jgi:hypothetical protein